MRLRAGLGPGAALIPAGRAGGGRDPAPPHRFLTGTKQEQLRRFSSLPFSFLPPPNARNQPPPSPARPHHTAPPGCLTPASHAHAVRVPAPAAESCTCADQPPAAPSPALRRRGARTHAHWGGEARCPYSVPGGAGKGGRVARRGGGL